MTQLQFNLDFEKVKDAVMQSDLNDVMKSSIVVLFNQYMEMERDKHMNNTPLSEVKTVTEMDTMKET